MPGSACARRSAPHSMAASFPARTVTQRSRASVPPGWSSETPRADTGGATTLISVCALAAAGNGPAPPVTVTPTVATLPSAPVVTVTPTLDVSPAASVSVPGLGVHPVPSDHEHEIVYCVCTSPVLRMAYRSTLA